MNIPITHIEIRTPKNGPKWPDEEWISAILGSPLGAPERIGLRHEDEDGLCIDFDFGEPAHFTFVFSCHPGKRRGAGAAKRVYPFCWSPDEVTALLTAVAERRADGFTLEAAMASMQPPEGRA